MEQLKKLIRSRFSGMPNVISVAIYQNTTPFLSHTDNFDVLIVIVTETPPAAKNLFHYIKEGCRIQEQWLSPAELEAWLFSGENRNIIYWILQGEIIVDSNTYLEGLRHKLLEFSNPLKEQKLLVEFSLFLSKYLQSKEYLNADHYLDAYSKILEALHHWAHLAIIEEGIHPELTVWRQVRSINPGIYKLYEELTLSSETLEKRVELVILACEFSVMSKMKSSSNLLLRIVESREEAWSVNELRNHSALKDVHFNIAHFKCPLQPILLAIARKPDFNPYFKLTFKSLCTL